MRGSGKKEKDLEEEHLDWKWLVVGDGIFISVSGWRVGSPIDTRQRADFRRRIGQVQQLRGMQLIQYFVFGIYKL